MSKELLNTLDCIAEGAVFSVQPGFNTTLVRVENPKYEEDNGQNPYLVFEVLNNA